MRIQIKVYIKAKKDLDCAGEKPDFFVTAPSIDIAVEELYDLIKPISEKLNNFPKDEKD